jgi:hypothetical protein
MEHVPSDFRFGPSVNSANLDSVSTEGSYAPKVGNYKTRKSEMRFSNRNLGLSNRKVLEKRSNWLVIEDILIIKSSN